MSDLTKKEYSTNRSDYQSDRLYLTALEYNRLINKKHLSKTAQRLLERCEFILTSDVLAAKYLNKDGLFLFGLAVKDNFDVKIGKISEDSFECYYMERLLLVLADKNCEKAVNIWLWCLQIFL